MPHAPVIGELVTDMNEIVKRHRPSSRASRRIPTREALQARESAASTRWCATCNTALDPDKASTYCKKCVTYRDNWKKRQKRLVKDGVVAIHREINDEIVAASDQLEYAIRRLAAARGRSEPGSKEMEMLITEMYERTLVLTTLIGEHFYTPPNR